MIAPSAAASLVAEPFPHTTATGVISNDLGELVLDWMETEAPWRLQIASFYEQWEMHLDAENLPDRLRALCMPTTIAYLSQIMMAPLGGVSLRLTDVTAHRLVAGQTIRIHNDYRAAEETHRLIVQLNRGWKDEQGGLLMLFSSSSVDDVRKVLRPLHRSAMAFSITSRSFHAVSTVRSGERFTLVYSFRDASLKAR